MTSLRNFAEIEVLLAKYVPLTRTITGRDITLQRMSPLMNALGNPHEKLKIIHVAGTSGKTSTCYYIAGLLSLSGKKVGLTVSPHIDSVAERIQLNMQLLSEIEFVSALNEFMDILNKSDIEPTYFELLVSFAYWYFERSGVDYAVIETGLGGLHDATNIAKNQDKVCVITDIGLDHMHVLGNTVGEIARQKAGIIYPGNNVFMYKQAEEIMKQVVSRCDEAGADLNVLDEGELLKPIAAGLLRGTPAFQQRNFLLANKVFEHILQRDGHELPDWDTRAEALKIRVPGRMDEVVVSGKRIIMDGAHNEQKTESFVSSFRQMYPDQKVPVILSLKKGKEFMAVLPLLQPITSKLIVTNYETSQDLPVVSVDAEKLASMAVSLGFDNVVVEADKEKAYRVLLEEPGNLGIITGSFYLIGQLRHRHKELIK